MCDDEIFFVGKDEMVVLIFDVKDGCEIWFLFIEWLIILLYEFVGFCF